MALMDYAIPLVTMLAVATLVWAIYAATTARQGQVQERIGQYSGAAAAAQVSRVGLPWRDRSLSSIDFLDKLLTGNDYANRAQLDLFRAAVPLRVGEYLLIRWLLACALFFVVRAFGVLWPLAVLVGVIGYFLPRFWVSGKERARVRQVDDQLVDALTMMSNSLKSGASFLQAMEMVSRELPAPLAPEFAQVVAEIGVGASVETALTDMSQRVRSYDLYLIVTAIMIQCTAGGNLAEVLGNIAHTIRERQRLLRQVQVETAE
ncbi:MAG: type II secretion system F family protein, partial [Chloroflexota bacterium]